MKRDSTKERAVEMLKNTDKSKREIAKELNISRKSVAAYEAHCTMGTYDGEEKSSTKTYALSRERDIEMKIAENPAILKDGMTLTDSGRQYQTGIGRIDLLAEDKNGKPVVVEIKKNKAKDNALGQIIGYIEEVEDDRDEEVRGIIVAKSFSDRVRKASNRFPELELYSYEVNFSFSQTAVTR